MKAGQPAPTVVQVDTSKLLGEILPNKSIIYASLLDINGIIPFTTMGDMISRGGKKMDTENMN